MKPWPRGSFGFLALAACKGRPGRIITRFGLSLVVIGSIACRQPGTGRVQLTPLDSANALQVAIARVATRSARSVVSLKCLDSTGRDLRRGSGFVVGGGRIATNVHLVRGCWRVEVRDQRGDLLLTTHYAAAYCNFADVAVLPAIPSPRSTLRLTRALPDVGQPIVVIGAPERSTQTVSGGLVSAIPNGDDGRLVQITAQVSPGSSGGPVLDLHGDAVGIAVAQFPERQDRTYAVPASAITTALASDFRRIALTDIPGGQEADNAQRAQGHEGAASDDSTVAADIRRARAIVDSAVWDTASATPCTRQRDTVCLRKLRDVFVPRIASARVYLAAGFASHDSTVWLMTALVAESGGTKLAKAGAYDQAYEWLDQLMIELARESSTYLISQTQQIRVQASFWFGVADAVTLQVPYRQMVESKSCIIKDLVKRRIQRGLDALEVGASVAPAVASQMRNILLQYSSNMPKVSPTFACDYC